MDEIINNNNNKQIINWIDSNKNKNTNNTTNNKIIQLSKRKRDTR